MVCTHGVAGVSPRLTGQPGRGAWLSGGSAGPRGAGFGSCSGRTPRVQHRPPVGQVQGQLMGLPLSVSLTLYPSLPLSKTGVFFKNTTWESEKTQ